MDNNLPYVNSFEELYWQYDNIPVNYPNHLPVPLSLNRAPKVLVNPNFKPSCKVYVNPNFSGTFTVSDQARDPASVSDVKSDMLYSTKIHINPNIQRSEYQKAQTIHVNPKFAQESVTQCIPQSKDVTAVMPKKTNTLVILSKTKLVRNSANYNTPSKIITNRRNSVKSKYKIIKTGLSPVQKNVNKMAINSGIKHRYKIDHRQLQVARKNKVNPVKVLIKPRIVKGRNKSIVYINGIAYKKSVSSLRRSKSITSSPNKPIKHTPRKINPQLRDVMVKKSKIGRKLKKCNIPCPMYRKYGVCKLNIKGKCNLKHDPNQIALCTRFLQGACIKEKCLLSHNVSPEKMPTCKYYLEGSCTKENCPYLHVKISAKADICREFLEGYCQKGAECYKRHQYLCPDYEKYGKCMKPRCLYPHGHLVRPYLINNDKFAKNYPGKTKVKKLDNSKKAEDTIEKKRYYIEKKCELNVVESCKNTEDLVGLRARPKLGTLPAFIPFKDS